KRRADVSAVGKLQLYEQADRLVADSGSKRDARRRLQAEYGISESFATSLLKPAKRAKVEQFVQTTPQGRDGLRPQGSHLGYCHLGSKSLGKRLPGPGKSLGRPDYLKPVWQQTARWSQYEEANQQTLSPADLLDDFLDRLELRLAVREAEEKAGTLTPQAEAELQALRQKQQSMQTNQKAREKYKASLVVKCQLRSRACQQVKNLSPAEEKARMEVAWRIWDQTLQAAADPSGDQALPVAEPHDFAANRAETAITLSDQIPVWLKPTPGKVLTSLLRLKVASEQRCFQPQREPQGLVSSSILVVYMDNTAGQIMKSWRKLRANQPELFADDAVRIWSQPAAVVDSVIYRWQLELEAEETPQALNLVDYFAAAWTPDSLHAAALLQRAQVGVAAGCTGLSQVTDIGFASQAKAALHRWSEDVKQAMRLKARRQGVPCTYRTQCSDILKAARAMHSQMVSQNLQERTVLRAARQGGWLHYRPDETGKLQLVQDQAWAADLQEGNDKLGADHLADRESWVQAGQVQPFTDEELKSSEKADAMQLEATYLISQSTGEIAGLSLTDFSLGLSVLAQTEQEFLQRAQEALPPSQRRILREAVVSQTTSQQHKKRQRQKSRFHAKQALQEWRQQKGRRSAETVLKQLVPRAGKKAGRPSLKLKPSLKQKPSLKFKASASSKPSLAEKELRKDQEKTQARSRQAQQQKAPTAFDGPLKGKQARVVGDTVVPASLRGEVVQLLQQTDTEVRVQAASGQHWVRQADVTTDCWDKIWPDFLDLSQVSPKTLQAEEQHLRDLAVYQSGQLLTDSQLQAGQPAGLHVLQPAQLEVILQTGQLPQELQPELQAALQAAKPMLVLAVVHSQTPRHYSLVVLERDADKHISVRLRDSLPSESAYNKCLQLQKLFFRKAGLPDNKPLPPPAGSFRQKDGFSCGLWAIAFAEAEWRLFLGESRQALDLDLATRVDRLNRWIVALLRTRHSRQVQQQTAKDAAAACQPHQAAAAAAAAGLAEAAVKAKTAAEAAQPPQPPAKPVFGCSKCRHSPLGCLQCNPGKLLKHAAKQEAAEAAASQKESQAAEASQAGPSHAQPEAAASAAEEKTAKPEKKVKKDKKEGKVKKEKKEKKEKKG
ncbi:unnamed protein product, partial [Symbiodinium necroappetens]